MRGKRRKPSLELLARVEEENEARQQGEVGACSTSRRPSKLIIPNKMRRRRSDFETLSMIEQDPVQKRFEVENFEDQEEENIISCAQSNKRVNDSSASKVDKKEENVNGYVSDDDLFGDVTTLEPEYELPLSTVSLPRVSPIPMNNKSASKSFVSLNWGGDNTVDVKFLEHSNKAEFESELSTVDGDKCNEKSLMKMKPQNSRFGPQNDSVFGDIDLSCLENQISGSKVAPEESKNRGGQSGRNVLESPVMGSAFQEISDSPKCVLDLGDFSNNLSKPITASTPLRSPSLKKGLVHKITERLKANANQQTVTSFQLQDVGKIFPEIFMDMSNDSQMLSQKPLHPKVLGPFYGLPMRVKELMHSIRGIKTFYDWQEKCLILPSVLQRKNLIYSLPTSGGKTLVAEMLILKELLCYERDAILVLHFVAIVQEKVRSIAQFADELDFLVEEYAGSKGRIPPTKRRKRKSLYVCTIEKANSLVNSLIEADRLDSLGLVVVDELHMLGEGGRRGATIEMMLAKLMHVSSSTQIIGMSATLSNIQDLSLFLCAEVYTDDFRPVALDEHVKCDESIYKVDPTKLNPDERLQFARVIDFASKEMAAKDNDHLATLALEVIPDHSCLIFCPTKKNCENVATMICKLLPESFKSLKAKEKKDILETLYQDSGGAGICPVLTKTLPYGVAYHHSGLTSDERRLIEEAYNDGILCVIACTSTLAAGVNLPARRVIIRSPYVGRDFLSRSQYKQMVGRAGRAGIDTKGESFLILTKAQDKQKVLELVTGPVETCISSLMYDGGKGFKTLILSLTSLKVMKKLSDVKDFFDCTLLSVQLQTQKDRFLYLSTGINNGDSTDTCELDSIENVARNALQELLNLKLIRLSKITEDNDDPVTTDFWDSKIEVTKLGAATNRGSIDFALSNIVYHDLEQGLCSLVLSNYLHLLYLVTPHDSFANVKPNWMIYFEEYGKLTADEQQAATVIGVPENYVAMKAAGHRIRNKKYKAEVISRFYVTLMLYYLFRGRSVWHVSACFEQPRGFLQTLLSSAAAFASCLLYFTKGLEELWPYRALLEKLIQHIQYCSSAELLPLMEIPGVKLARAKQLCNAGYKSLAQIAKADVSKLLKSVQHLSRRQALQITASAKVLLKEKIEELQAQADELQMVPNLP